MKKKIIFILSLMLMISINSVFAGQFNSESGMVTIITPDTIDLTKTFDVQIKINDEELKEKVDTIEFDSCYVARSSLENVKYDDMKDFFMKKKYSGESTLKFSLFYPIDTYNFENQNSNIICSIDFIDSSDSTHLYVDSVQYIINTSDLRVSFNPPTELSIEYNDDDSSFFDKYFTYTKEKKDENYRIYMIPTNYLSYAGNVDDEYSFLFDFKNKNYNDLANHYFKSNSQLPIEHLGPIGNSEDGYYQFGYSTNFLDDDKLSITAEMNLISFYETFDVGHNYYKKIVVDTTGLEDYDSIIAKEVKKMKNEFISVAQTLTIDSEGSNSVSSSFKEIEEKNSKDLSCYSDSDCYKGELCSACGVCKLEKELYPEDEVKIDDVSFSSKFTNKEIYNKISSLIIARITPKFKFINNDGEKITYCDMKKGSFNKLILKGEIKEDDRYSGFTSGMLYDNRDKERKRIIDLSDKNQEIAFFISPNDREKNVGEILELQENVDFSILNDNNELFKKEFTYTLKPYNFDINIKTNSKQMQQDSSKAIAFKLNNPFAKNAIVEVKLFGLGGIEKNEKGFKHTVDDEIITRKSFVSSFKVNHEYKFAYYSAELGNADIGEALSGLSMVKLQKEGAKASAIDTLSLGAGSTMEKGSKIITKASESENKILNIVKGYYKSNPKLYSSNKIAKLVHNANFVNTYGKNFEKAKKLVDNGNNIYGLSQMYGASSSALKGYNQMQQDKNLKIDKSWAEVISDVGVGSINVLQAGVGGVMLVAGKVPGFGPAAQAIFSWTTNIWKANFQYIASSERIDRIQELFMPALIVVDASDESGWTTRKLVVIKVAYHQI